MDHGGDFIEHVNRQPEVTLFVPSNEAWNNPEVQKALA